METSTRNTLARQALPMTWDFAELKYAFERYWFNFSGNVHLNTAEMCL